MPGTPANVLSTGSTQRDLTFEGLDLQTSETFRNNQILWPLIRAYVLKPGETSHKFPIRGGLIEAPSRKARGQAIQGGTVANTSKVITLDDPMISSLELDQIDLENSGWDQIRPSVMDTARKVAEDFETRTFRVLALAARTAAVTNVHPGGLRYNDNSGDATLATRYALSSTGADRFEAAVANLAYLADQDPYFWPDDGNRWLYIPPYIRQVLTFSTRVMNRDYQDPGNSMFAKRWVGVLHSFKLVVTRNLPTTNTTDLTKYQISTVSFNGSSGAGLPAALAMYVGATGPDGQVDARARGPIGLVHAGGPVSKVTAMDEWYESLLVKTRLPCGLDVLEPWAAGEIYI